MATLAVFLVIAGGTALAAALPANSVTSKTVKDNSLKSRDLKNGKAVTAADVADESLTIDDLGTRSVSSSEIEDGGVDTAEVEDNGLLSADITDNTLTGADVNESSLGRVPSADLGGIGRSASPSGECDPESTTFAPCVSVSLNLPSPARVLLVGRIRASTEVDSDSGIGTCRVSSSVGGGVAASETTVVVDDSNFEHVPLTAVLGPLGPGNLAFAVECNQGGFGAIRYSEMDLSAVALSSS
jgi:hypothetical protein